MHFALATAWILVVRPPRERPVQFRSSHLVPEHLNVGVVLVRYGNQNIAPDAGFSSPMETNVVGGARTIADKQITPWRPGLQNPEDAVLDTSVIDTRDASRIAGRIG